MEPKMWIYMANFSKIENTEKTLIKQLFESYNKIMQEYL